MRLDTRPGADMNAAGTNMRNSRMTTVLMQIKVKPRARMSALTQTADGTWLAKLKSPPQRGSFKQVVPPDTWIERY